MVPIGKASVAYDAVGRYQTTEGRYPLAAIEYGRTVKFIMTGRNSQQVKTDTTMPKTFLFRKSFSGYIVDIN